MDARAALALYDEQVRRRPEAETPGLLVERADGVVRVVSPEQGWMGVTWSALDERSADAAIVAQVARFAQLGGGWEWKHYSYDEPADLPDRLRAAGLRPEPPEALLAADLQELRLDAAPPAGVRLVEVDDAGGVEAFVGFYAEVLGEDRSALAAALATALEGDPPAVRAVLAIAGGTVVGAGRVQLPPSIAWAGLWGGAVRPAWRRRGVFRALVARRAALATAAGFRYVHVDAVPASRPILRRLGFTGLATTTPWALPPTPERRKGARLVA